MKTIKKRSTLIIFVIIIALDYKFNFLSKLLENDNLEKLIKFIGALGFAKTTNSDLTTSLFSKDDETDIGGGGIKNPKDGGQ